MAKYSGVTCSRDVD